MKQTNYQPVHDIVSLKSGIKNNKTYNLTAVYVIASHNEYALFMAKKRISVLSVHVMSYCYWLLSNVADSVFDTSKMNCISQNVVSGFLFMGAVFMFVA